ncbi:MAG: hypothetical protein AB7O43_07960 [Hyphomicrobiaceae bacterium]
MTAIVVMLAGLLHAAAASAGCPVSKAEFRAILAELTARPNIPPRLMPASQAAGDRDALKACGMPRRELQFSVPQRLPDQAGLPSRFRIDHQRLPILSDAGSRSRGAVFAIAGRFAVNADAAPRAYHPLDPFGRCTGKGKDRICALDALCNAGVRIFRGKTEIKCQDRDAYSAAWKEMWGLISERKARPIPRRYWRLDRTRTTNTHYGFFHPDKSLTVIMRHNIIPHDRNLRPCVRDVAGTRFAGYFVSKTSLRGNQGADEAEGPAAADIVKDHRCNPLPYANPEVLRGVVIPVGGFAGAKVGDLAVIYRKAPGGPDRFVYAVVSDQGPNHAFGEGSIALNAALKGIAPNVNSIADLYRLDISSKDDGKERIGVLILRGTAGVLDNLSQASIDAAVAKAFQSWGGGSADKAKQRFMACMAALR